MKLTADEHAQKSLFVEVQESDVRYAAPTPSSLVVVSDTIALEGARKRHLKVLRDKYGFEPVNETQQGKTLVKAMNTINGDAAYVAQAANAIFRMGGIKAAHPNFIRMLLKPKPSAPGGSPLWNHQNHGNPGLAGADVAVLAAWTITRGSKHIRVAVLDEGVDSKHPALKNAVAAESDFVDNNPHSRPDGDDAHGTACAGIIASRDAKIPGIAPECMIVGVRIAKDDGTGNWVFDDFNTADAIDWAWNDGAADVLSNSWGGGPPVDVITNAFRRARIKGRGGKGSIVVIASGNENGAVSYPGTLDDVLTVGASNPWDERKSPTSQDGENWGSNYGPALDLMAPGVKIATTDIAGAAGYSGTDFTDTFNGTSSATPHVAAAAALVLSLAPDLKEKRVREILTLSADKLTPTGQWDKFHGHGRLNVFSALRLALR